MHFGIALEDLLQALSRDGVRGAEHPDQPQAPTSWCGAPLRRFVLLVPSTLSNVAVLLSRALPWLFVGAEREAFLARDPV